MTIVYNPRIITDGLVLYLDAGNRRSYPGNDINIYDISGNMNNAVFVSGVTYINDKIKAFSFDATDDRIIVPDNNNLDIVGNKTLCCWVKLSNDSNGCAIAGKMDNVVRGMALAYGWNSQGFQAIAWNSSNSPQLSKDLDRDINKWVYLVAIQNQSIRTIYAIDKLGIRLSSSSTGGTHSWDNTADFVLSKTSTGSSSMPSNSQIALVHVYNRVLFINEIIQNFNSLKGRFNL